jgi:hypothetical protein
MNDYMITVVGGLGARDVQVNGCADIREAIAIAERETHLRVDHGRGGIGSKFDPAIIIDAPTGAVERRHDREAIESLTFADPRARVSVRRGT